MSFVARHPHSTIFHSVGWLQALQRTYGYNPVVFTTSPPGAELQNGVAFCEVKSWLTGRRIVSLPFSDHCEPLVTNLGDLPPILSYLKNQSSHSKWKYIELRPLSDEMVRDAGAHFKQSDMHHFHKIDLRPAAETIFRGFHDSCVRRKIRKAEREELRYRGWKLGTPPHDPSVAASNPEAPQVAAAAPCMVSQPDGLSWKRSDDSCCFTR